MAITQADKKEILDAIKAESLSVDELTEVTNLNGIHSFPVFKGGEIVRVPISLLKVPLEQTVTESAEKAPSCKAVSEAIKGTITSEVAVFNEINLLDYFLKGYIGGQLGLFSYNPTVLKGYNCFYGLVSEGDSFEITNLVINGSIIPYRVYNKNGQHVKAAEGGRTIASETLTIEQDGYIVFNSSNLESGSIRPVKLKNPKQFLSVMTDIATLPTALESAKNALKDASGTKLTLETFIKDEEFTSFADGEREYAQNYGLTYETLREGWFGSSVIGTKIDLNKPDKSMANRRYWFMSVHKDDIIELDKALGHLTGYPWAFLDKDMTVISVSPSANIDTVGNILEIPENAAYILMQTSLASYWDFSLNKDLEINNFIRQYNRANLRPEIKILFCGNSFTEDSVSYLPYLLKKFAPDVKFTIGLAAIGGCTLAQHCANFNNAAETLNGANVPVTNYQFSHASDANVKWTTLVNQPAQSLLNFAEWDIITFQQNGADAASDFNTYYVPFIIKLQNAIYQKCNKPVKLGWVLTHGSYSSSTDTQKQRWEGTVENTKKLFGSTGISLIFPYGTAIQNLRSTSLNDIADYPGLVADEIHLQEGLPTLCASYTMLLKVLEILGNCKTSILGDRTEVSQELIDEIGVRGPNYGTKGIIGMSDPNRFVAQIAAINAVKNPYEITDLEGYV